MGLDDYTSSAQRIARVIYHDWIYTNFKGIVQIKYNNSEYREDWDTECKIISFSSRVYLHIMRFNVRI